MKHFLELQFCKIGGNLIREEFELSNKTISDIDKNKPRKLFDWEEKGVGRIIVFNKYIPETAKEELFLNSKNIKP